MHTLLCRLKVKNTQLNIENLCIFCVKNMCTFDWIKHAYFLLLRKKKYFYIDKKKERSIHFPLYTSHYILGNEVRYFNHIFILVLIKKDKYKNKLFLTE